MNGLTRASAQTRAQVQDCLPASQRPCTANHPAAHAAGAAFDWLAAHASINSGSIAADKSD